MTESAAVTALQQQGLRVGTIKHKQQTSSAGYVIGQLPSQGSQANTGSAVDLVVAVSLAAPAPSVPRNGEKIPRGQNFPTLSWAPVPNAAKYRVTVETELCVFVIVIVCAFPAPGENKFGGSYANYHARSSYEVSGTTVTPKLTLTAQPGVPRAGHSGNVRWQVVPLDDYGSPGAESAAVQFHMALRDPDVWGPVPN